MVYQALNSATDEIRLITILPRHYGDTFATAQDIKQHDPIYCRLETVCLNDHYLFKGMKNHTLPTGIWTESSKVNKVCPRFMHPRYTWGDYVALSYTWGDASVTREIFINGTSVHITKNLEAAIRTLREKAPIRAGFKVWVDAICIQQCNIEERNRQIKRMQTIYQKASDVVVWLGSEDDDSSTAMDFMKALSGCWAIGCEEMLRDSLRRELKGDVQGIWEAFNRLMGRPYWARLWVIQEIATGNGSTPVLCGSRAVSWNDFYKTLYYFNSPAKDSIANCIDGVFNEMGLSFWDLENARVYYMWNRAQDLQDFQEAQAKGYCPELTTVLRFGRQKSASDPRDKIYGLMGLFDCKVDFSCRCPSFLLSWIVALGHD